MPDRIVLNTPRYKGEYELDFEGEPLSALEWHWVKKISGYTLGTVGDAADDNDPMFFVAIAAVALVRAGRVRRDGVFAAAEELAELPFDGERIRYVGDAAEAGDGSPPTEPAAAPQTEPPPASTGGSSQSTWGHQEPVPTPIGAPD